MQSVRGEVIGCAECEVNVRVRTFPLMHHERAAPMRPLL